MIGFFVGFVVLCFQIPRDAGWILTMCDGMLQVQDAKMLKRLAAAEFPFHFGTKNQKYIVFIRHGTF